MQDMGRDIILAGLIAQIVFFLAFFVLALYVGNSTRYGMYRMTQRKQILAGLFSTILLMLVRNVYRVLDKAVDETNPITADEWVSGWRLTGVPSAGKKAHALPE